MYRYWAPVAAARRGFKMVLFTASRGNTFVGGICALPSALLVQLYDGCYRATRVHSADYAVAICPSVRLSGTRRYCV